MLIKNVLMDDKEGLYIDLSDIKQRLDNIHFGGGSTEDSGGLLLYNENAGAWLFYNNSHAPGLQYKIGDNGSWKDMSFGTKVIVTDQYLYLRGQLQATRDGSIYSYRTSIGGESGAYNKNLDTSSYAKYGYHGYFEVAPYSSDEKLAPKIHIKNSLDYLLDYKNVDNICLRTYTSYYDYWETDHTVMGNLFGYLFAYNDYIYDISELKFCKYVATGMYDRMFESCKNLGKLPAGLFTPINIYKYKMDEDDEETVHASPMGEGAFDGTFYKCTSLTLDPEFTLPFQPYIPTHGYANMFWGCTNIGLILYNKLFEGATDADYGACFCMFQGCTGIQAMELDLLRYLTNTGDNKGIAAERVFEGMFESCTKLMNVGHLPYDKKLGVASYEDMFAGCTSLCYVPADLISATEVSEDSCMGMFSMCAALKTPVYLHATELKDNCYAHMFYGTGITLSTKGTDEALAWRLPVTGTGVDKSEKMNVTDTTSDKVVGYYYSARGMMFNVGTFTDGKDYYKASPNLNTTYYMSETPSLFSNIDA